MELTALISGGKDSIYAMHLMASEHVITNLVSIIAEKDSYLYHTTNIHLTRTLSEVSGIPLLISDKKDELGALRFALAQLETDGIVFGAIESNYQRRHVEKVCEEFDLELFAPLWHVNVSNFMEDMIKILDVRIVHVAAMGFDRSWLGRRIDEGTLEDLKNLSNRYRFHLAGEGGEYETMVLDAPLFKKRIEISEANPIWYWYGGYGTLKISSVRTIDKDG